MTDYRRCFYGQPGVKPYLAHRYPRVSQSSIQPFQSVERKLTGIYNWEKRQSTFEWILKKYITEEWDETPAKNVLDLCQNRQ